MQAGRWRNRLRRGSTVMEVMMAIAVFSIGVTGVISLQKVVLANNRNASSMAVAGEIAKSWIERLKGESLLWNYPSDGEAASDLETDTEWLAKIEQGFEGKWFRPRNDEECGTHDAFGQVQPCGNSEAPSGPFCVNLRLRWLRDTKDLILGEVRVYWLFRNDADSGIPTDLLPCGSATSPPDVRDLADKGIMRMVYTSTALLKNGAR